MPQLDIVSFHYITHIVSAAYLIVYMVVSLVFLKPIFKELFVLSSLPVRLVFSSKIFCCLCSDKSHLTLDKSRINPPRVFEQVVEVWRVHFADLITALGAIVMFNFYYPAPLFSPLFFLSIFLCAFCLERCLWLLFCGQTSLRVNNPLL